jgi:hypothetical protein
LVGSPPYLLDKRVHSCARTWPRAALPPRRLLIKCQGILGTASCLPRAGPAHYQSICTRFEALRLLRPGISVEVSLGRPAKEQASLLPCPRRCRFPGSAQPSPRSVATPRAGAAGMSRPGSASSSRGPVGRPSIRCTPHSQDVGESLAPIPRRPDCASPLFCVHCALPPSRRASPSVLHSRLFSSAPMPSNLGRVQMWKPLWRGTMRSPLHSPSTTLSPRLAWAQGHHCKSCAARSRGALPMQTTDEKCLKGIARIALPCFIVWSHSFSRAQQTRVGEGRVGGKESRSTKDHHGMRVSEGWGGVGGGGGGGGGRGRGGGGGKQ